ncbi:MAG TPA: hypothetical protein VJT15_00710 [Pyrinomonadaceae bacterium]|nr:hypothetical protein [Pyrinomonadaceae bacterium]
MLLRAGVLTGLTGNNRQIDDAQESARNLISESLTIFQSQRYKTKAAEAQTELALCYWRTGEYENASDLLKLALGELTADGELKAKAIIRLAVVDIDAGRPTEALDRLVDSEMLFQKLNNHTLKGCYYQALGDALKDLWEDEKRTDYLDRALVEYAAASYYFDLADHKRYRANVENNLGLIYFRINRCKETHDHLDRARRIFVSLKDKIAVAQVDETRARAFLKENKHAEAEKTARSAVRSLEQSGIYLPLAESLTTHGTALARLGNYATALSTFRQAIDLHQQIGSLNRAGQAALTVFQEMGALLSIADGTTLISNQTLDEEIHSIEHDRIKRALEENQRKITYAARSLGVTYQTLNYMLKTRHNDLLKERTEMRGRGRNK